MTIETTTNEQPTPRQMAEAVVNNATPNAIIEEVERLIIDRDYYKNEKSLLNARYSELNKQLSHWKNSTTTFVTEFIKSDDVTTDDLKEFAEKMNIELTKEIEVTFKVDVKFTATVPLEFEFNEIDESDFDVTIEYSGNSDIDMEEEYSDIEDFDISENN